MDNSAIKVLVVDDHTLFAEGTVSLLSYEPNIAVVGIAPSAAVCLRVAKQACPHTILLDINLPDACGVNIIGKIKEAVPSAGIIMLTGQSPEGYVNASLAHGALGFLLKDCTKNEMVTAIKKAARGERYFSQSLLPYINEANKIDKENDKDQSGSKSEQSFSQTDFQGREIFSLTSRELEVLELIGEGLKNKEVAKRLSIKTRTVEYHVCNITEKLGVKSRLEAVLMTINKFKR